MRVKLKFRVTLAAIIFLGVCFFAKAELASVHPMSPVQAAIYNVALFGIAAAGVILWFYVIAVWIIFLVGIIKKISGSCQNC
jgi:hypothetical protein